MFFKCEDCGKRYFLPSKRNGCEVRHMFAPHHIPVLPPSPRPHVDHGRGNGRSYFVDNDVNFMFHALGLEDRIPVSDMTPAELRRHIYDDSVERLYPHQVGDHVEGMVSGNTRMNDCSRDNDPSPTPDNYESSSSSDGGCSGGD